MLMAGQLGWVFVRNDAWHYYDFGVLVCNVPHRKIGHMDDSELRDSPNLNSAVCGQCQRIVDAAGGHPEHKHDVVTSHTFADEYVLCRRCGQTFHPKEGS